MRVINRRAAGTIPPGPEELLWTGKGIVRFMGGRPGEFSPGPALTLAEVYLLADFLVPLWTPLSTEDEHRLPLESGLGRGYLTVLQDGRPESLVVNPLSRPLWDGSSALCITFEHKGESAPWHVARLTGSGGTSLILERLRFRRDKLSDDVFAVENEGGLRLADLSKPLGALVGSDAGGYAETAGSSAAFKSSKTVSSGGKGSLYLGPVPTPDEVDRFLHEGKLGRYADEE
ncbi:hypothetical protein JXA88_14540 [Candidatus Fermentibacteria bacterium]|nr:hypothetical protein [Candidatus Fermentibacteria bacterium]